MVIPEGFAQVNLKYTGTALPNGAQVTFGVANTIDLTPLAIAVSVRDKWQTAAIMAFFANTVSITSILVKAGPNEDGPSAELSTTIPGSSASEADTANVAVLVHKLTGAGGRHGRGRMYLPGIVDTNVDPAGTLNSTTRTNLTTNLETFRVAMSNGSTPLVLLHGDLTVPFPISALSVDARAATQRRRLRR